MVSGERGRALVELVELEGAGEALLAVVVEEVIGLLVVEDGAGPRRRRGAVADHRAAREVLELLDRPEPLLGVRLVPVVAVGEGDRLADVGPDVDLRLGSGAAPQPANQPATTMAQRLAAARGRRNALVRAAMAWAGS